MANIEDSEVIVRQRSYEYSPLIRDTDNEDLSEDSPPIDRLGIVKTTFALLGLSQLIPWNFLITANDYWNYKFRDINETNSGSTNSSITSLQKYFESYVAIATNLPFLMVLVLNAFFGHKIRDNIKNLWSLTAIVIIFIITTIFVKINTDFCQTTFLSLTITSIVLLSIFAAFLQSSISGIASLFPSECMHAMVSGQAVSGLFAASAQIMALLGQWPVLDTALYYFLMADITLIISLIMYLMINRTDFYKYHKRKVNENREQLNSLAASNEDNYLHSILFSIWPHLVSAVLVFTVSLAVFPAITVLVVPTEPNTSQWTGKYFIPITCFLLFNLSDFFGRFVGRFLPIPSQNKLLLLLTAISRIVLIPLIMFCNAKPRTHLPVLFDSEVYFILFITLLGFSNGFVLINIMISGPMVVPDQYKERAGFFIVTSVGLGLTLGSLSSNILVRLI